MSVNLINSDTRLHLEELEPRAMLSGSPLSSGTFQLDPIFDPFASGGGNAASSGVLTGAVFSSNGGFAGGGFATGGGFSTNVGFPVVGFSSGGGFSSGEGFSSSTIVATRLGVASGVPLPTGVGPSGVGFADASTVGEVIALGGNSRFGTESFGGDFSGGFEATGGTSFDAASGVGQMLITTGANTVGASILPTSGFSSDAGGSGGPLRGKAAPKEQRAPDGGLEAPDFDTAPSPLDSGGLDAHAEATDVALQVYLETASQSAA